MTLDRAPSPRSPLESSESPAFQLLTNGRYTVVLAATGNGFSAFDDYLLTTWRPDPVEGNCGFLIFLRDLETGAFWTACGRPLPGQEAGRIVREPAGLAIERLHNGVASHVEIRLHVSAGIEQRTCQLTNATAKTRQVEVTSFVEVALDHPLAHESHPAFSKLFVQTSQAGDGSTLTASRRPRAHGETAPVLLHALFDAQATDYGTDRARFIGRGSDLGRPRALTGWEPLGRVHGNVLDPALSLRTVLRIEPGASQGVRCILAAGSTVDVLRRGVEALRQLPLETTSVSRNVDFTNTARPRDDDRAEFIASLTRGLELPAAIGVQRASNPARALPHENDPSPPLLRFFNGYGGFSQDGREYVVCVPGGASNRPRLPPAPWINVIANADFGCLISETGAGTVWSGNSREHRLTPWSNDGVVDPHADAFYVRDDETGVFWSPMPGPAAAQASYEVRHGFGYSTWQLCIDDLAHETCVFVPETGSLRLTRVRIRNAGTRRRRLAVYAYNRWVLGTTPEATRTTLRTEFSIPLQALLARNVSPPDGLPAIAFLAANRIPLDGWCADRAGFLGVPGSPVAPVALTGDGTLSSACGDDPCGAVRVMLEIAPGMTGEVTFFLGAASSEIELEEVLATFRQPGHVEAALKGARAAWERMFSRLQVETPSAQLNFMINGWLPYQNISCRLWARSAFYQSGGAFGFRDQIQDATAIIHLRPDLTRAQILLHASRQFVEGDVQHWWHPPRGQGLRTRFADDLLWLPWVTSYYINVTGDRELLGERVRYLEARPLLEGEAEALLLPVESKQTGDLYEHCCRAIDRSLVRGEHGLPLFGAGDWNDGMNRVGHEGRGESVWMGFFLCTVLGDFLPLCDLRGDELRAARYRKHREELIGALNTDGWDGSWYRRGWYDNGAVLGSRSSDECRIDALVQAWAAMSKAAPPERIDLALDSLESHLIDDQERLIRLLAPPFADTPNDPGYIKGYVAGVRENGGQYTHAATWVVRAMAEAGRRNRAMELLEGLIPINHSLDSAAAEKYKVEPYVVAADIYGAEPHVGRGGWTWYTGSAGWMYRVAVETMLGFSIEGGDVLCLRSRIPDAWAGFELHYEMDDRTRILIDVRNPDRRAERIVSARFDGAELELRSGELRLALPRTGREHRLIVVVGGDP